MIDSLKYALRQPTKVLGELSLAPKRYAVATLHRPANVDDREALGATLDALEAIGARLPVVFPVHPRTTARAEALGLAARMRAVPGLMAVAPVGYNDFVTLMGRAALVATDSGGIQEETTALGIPCLTLRDGTERPIAVDEGTNTIVGLDPKRIGAEVDAVLAGRGKVGKIPEGWDGRAGERIADALEALLRGTPPPKRSGPRA